jgi:hypothetical protein
MVAGSDEAIVVRACEYDYTWWLSGVVAILDDAEMLGLRRFLVCVRE